MPAQSVQTSNVAAPMEADFADFPDWIPVYDLPYLGLDGFGFTLPGQSLSPNLDWIGAYTCKGTNDWTQMALQVMWECKCRHPSHGVQLPRLHTSNGCVCFCEGVSVSHSNTMNLDTPGTCSLSS